MSGDRSSSDEGPIVLRPPQVDALRPVHSAAFEEEFLEHLHECFPEHARALGRAGAVEVLRHGVERCMSYELHEPDEVMAYLEVMVLLGRDFDIDPALPWVREILGSDELHPRARAGHLTRTTLEYLRGLEEAEA